MGRPKTNPQRVLVATDGSRGGKAALRFAARLAASAHTALTVITVAPDCLAADGNGEPQASNTLLGKAASQLRRLGVAADLHVVNARPKESIPEAITRESERLKADLVVVGSEGRDTLHEWVVGGVALRLIYLATRPVTVVRSPRLRRHA